MVFVITFIKNYIKLLNSENCAKVLFLSGKTEGENEKIVLF